jgi:hypothetical protein
MQYLGRRFVNGRYDGRIYKGIWEEAALCTPTGEEWNQLKGFAAAYPCPTIVSTRRQEGTSQEVIR